MAKSTKWLDGVAVGLSALCLIHCLALPVIVAGLPFLAQFADGHLHAQMLLIVLPLSIIASGSQVPMQIPQATHILESISARNLCLWSGSLSTISMA